MKICIYGSGAMGSYIAAHLVRGAQSEVSVVARGGTLAAIQANGLRVITDEEEFTVPVRAVADPAELGVQDVVIITLKMHHVDEVLDQIRHLIGPDTAIIPPIAALPYYFLSGLTGPFRDQRLPRIDPTGRQRAVMPPEQVLGCPYWIGVHAHAPGVTRRDGKQAMMPLGELTGQRSDRVEKLSAILEAAGIEAPISDNIHGDVWVKFANSMCWNPVAILTMARLGEIGSSDGAGEVVHAMLEESDAIGRALGVEITVSPRDRLNRTLRGTHHKMSMLQDFERGRPNELELLHSSLLSITRLTGVKAPTLKTVYALARLRVAIAESK
ncbi:2-dehydropantoate 2-reductase [Sphingomonas sp. TF3]|uniref:ketopantoate reductase family protein n=1 Tax=Sphingomonas sp. TF3 TaxID=2495580 RepID=UPI000F881B09|nr:2-dehydropantoate 2-reductase [Sphingomonas sp. TF3]RUN76515.1 2-dehydropantoate 2-reductase [Sphingomonas sp. TF3]